MDLLNLGYDTPSNDQGLKNWCTNATAHQNTYCFRACFDGGYKWEGARGKVEKCCSSCKTCSNKHPQAVTMLLSQKEAPTYCDTLSDKEALHMCTSQQQGWQKNGYCTRTCAEKIVSFKVKHPSQSAYSTPTCCE